MAVAEKYLQIAKEYLKYHFAGHVLAALVFCGAAPLIVGMEALDVYRSAQVMEMYLSMIGIILLVPLFWPDQNKEIRDLLASKEMPVLYVHLVRLLEALAVLFLMITGFLLWMRCGECTFDFVKCFWGTFVTCLFMGGMGVFIYGVFDNLPVAYMVPMMYYICNYGAGKKYMGPFVLFSMMSGSYTEKIWIGLAGLVLLTAGIFCRNIKTIKFYIYRKFKIKQ